MTESISKSKSVLMLSLLLLAPILLLVTPNVAYAATPSISLSTSSGPGAGNTAGIKITGTGFPQLSSGTGIKLLFISTGKSLSIAGATAVRMYGQSLFGVPNSITQSNCVNTGETNKCGLASVDGNGNFQAFFDTPSLPGDTYNVFVSYTPSGGSVTTSSPITFQITSYLTVVLADDKGLDATAGAATTKAHWGQWVRITVYGFGASETVTITGLPLPASATSITMSTNSVGSASSTSAQKIVRLIGETTGGSKTFTAVGSTSGLTATRSFTINPSIALYPSQTGATTISVPASAPATTYLELHGFGNGETISAATIGGIAANFGAVTTGTDGSYGVGSGAHLSLLYTSSLSFGSISITVTGSKTGTVTFNAANNNVVNPFGAAGTTNPTSANSGVQTPGGLAPFYTLDLTGSGGGVPILASTSQSSGTSIIGFSETTGFVGDTVALYLTGWGPLGVSIVTSATAASGIKFDTTRVQACAGSPISLTNCSLSSTLTSATASLDSNGAGVLTIAIPSSLRGAHTITVTAGSGATNPGTTFNIKPQLLFYTTDQCDTSGGYAAFTNSGTESVWQTSAGVAISNPSSCSSGTSIQTYRQGYVAVSGTGFGADSSTTEALSLSIGSTVISSSFATPSSSTGSFSIAAISTTGVPDLAAGAYKVTAVGASTGDNATGYDSYYLTQGQVVTSLNVLPNFELSTILSVTSVVQGQTVVLQTATTTGIHGLKPSSAYTVNLDGPSGTQLTTFTSTSGGGVAAGTQFVVPTSSAGVHIVDIVSAGASAVLGASVNVVWDNSLDENTYGTLYISVTGSVAVTPSAGNVGSVVSLSGTGIAASTKYNVQLTSGIAYASFTSTAGGAIPAGVSFPFPAIGSTTETGTSETIQLMNTATGSATPDATGTFLLQASMSIAPRTAAPGTSVKATAAGLVASQAYNIIWNAGLNNNGGTTGTIIGAFSAATDGSGSANFTVPATAAAGTYSVSLLRTGDNLGSTTQGFRLVTPGTVTVSIGGANLQGTSTFSASGAATQINLNGAPALQISYTNNVASAVTGIVYAVVHNAAGQTVYYTTATVTPGAGATVTAYLILAGLPSGTYSVTIFAVTPSGVAISATSTATATL